MPLAPLAVPIMLESAAACTSVPACRNTVVALGAAAIAHASDSERLGESLRIARSAMADLRSATAGVVARVSRDAFNPEITTSIFPESRDKVQGHTDNGAIKPPGPILSEPLPVYPIDSDGIRRLTGKHPRLVLADPSLLVQILFNKDVPLNLRGRDLEERDDPFIEVLDYPVVPGVPVDRTLYSGQGAPPIEVFVNGLPKFGTNTDLARHVFTDDYAAELDAAGKEWDGTTGFVSTTRSPAYAEQLGDGQYTYVIYQSPDIPYRDVVAELGQGQSEQEMASPVDIPAEHIFGVMYDPDRITYDGDHVEVSTHPLRFDTMFLINPHFRYPGETP